MNLFSYFREEFGITRTEKLLEKINKVVPWKEFAREIERKRERGSGGMGRPRKDTVGLLKCLFLQGLYNLSDPETEDQLRDRISFQKFVGITTAKEIPDETTLCRFRNELVVLDFQEDVFIYTQRLLHEKGYTVEKGCIQDGTFLEQSKGKKNRYGESTRDPEATFTKKGGRTYHGYKAHIETNEKDPFILSTSLTTAKVHDSGQQNALMTGEETELYGDCAYGLSKKKNQLLRDMGLCVQFNERAVRNKPLTYLQKQQNRIKSCIRAKVEHPFAWIKTRYMKTRVRFRGLQKNAMDWFLTAAIYNFDLMARKFHSQPTG